MKKHIFYIIGLFLILLYNLPWILNGENASYRIYDLLEQDFVNIYLNAKYLFHPFVTEIPELFGGTFRGSIQAHSFLQIILYKFIQGVHFLNFNQILMQFVGFSGMYILLNKIYQTEESKVKSFINMGCSFLFCIPPLLLHGMTIMTMPLFAWALIKIFERENPKNIYFVYGVCVFIGLGTSLIYCGFLYLLILFGLTLYSVYKKKKNLATIYFSCMFIMLAGYVTTYFYSFLAMGEISHRIEIQPQVFEMSQNIINRILYSFCQLEAPIYPIIPIILFTISTFIVITQRKDNKEYKYAMYTFWLIIAINFFTASYSSSAIILKLRELCGPIFESIQWDRMAYIVSPLYTFFLCSVLLFLTDKLRGLKINKIIVYALLCISFALQFKTIINDTDRNYFYVNIHTLQGIEPLERTYTQFFQTDLMNEIRDYIGKPQDSYHIVSLGINPGVPLFNGFYCLDGYSTNYRLSYKKQWISIIKNELKYKNEEFQQKLIYGWGSRVYLISKELGWLRPPEMYDKKKYINKLDIDYAKLKELGADYLFSKYEIKEPNPYIKLEKVFYSKIDNGDKDFQVFLYSIHDAK